MGSREPASSALEKFVATLRGELPSLNPRLRTLILAASLLPRASASARARLFTLAGFRIGEGTRLHGTPRISGNGAVFERLVIGTDCSIDEGCAFDLEDAITIGNRVSFAPGVMLLTSNHEHDAGEQHARRIVKGPVKIEDGALIGARSVVLPGVTIGAGAIVNPGAIVKQDVPAHTRVGGVPAIQLEVLGSSESGKGG